MRVVDFQDGAGFVGIYEERVVVNGQHHLRAGRLRDDARLARETVRFDFRGSEELQSIVGRRDDRRLSVRALEPDAENKDKQKQREAEKTVPFEDEKEHERNGDDAQRNSQSNGIMQRIREIRPEQNSR